MDGNPHVYGVCSTMFVLMFFCLFLQCEGMKHGV